MKRSEMVVDGDGARAAEALARAPSVLGNLTRLIITTTTATPSASAVGARVVGSPRPLNWLYV
jgi:hypothetical protein